MLHVARVKGSINSTHSLDRDELRDLRKLRQQVTGLRTCRESGVSSVTAAHRLAQQRRQRLTLLRRQHAGIETVRLLVGVIARSTKDPEARIRSDIARSQIT